MTDGVLTPVQGIRRELQRSIRGYIAGDAAPRARTLPSDGGWFGPDSITWLVQTDWSVLVGGIESLLVQVLHPPTMAGVAEHSEYKDDMLGRLQRTTRFLGTTVFGTAEEAQRSVDIVRSIHDRVSGTTPDGNFYEANDPHNLLWVHATEIDGFLRAYRRYATVAITDAEADRYVAEMARVGEALGVRRAPRTVRELDDTLRSYIPELHYGSQARTAMRFLLFPPNRLAARAPYAVLLAAAIDLLPSWARRKLWIPPTILPIDVLAVRPAAGALLKTLNWIMEPPKEIEAIRAARAREGSRDSEPSRRRD